MLHATIYSQPPKYEYCDAREKVLEWPGTADAIDGEKKRDVPAEAETTWQQLCLTSTVKDGSLLLALQQLQCATIGSSLLLNK